MQDNVSRKSKLATPWKPVIDSHCKNTNKPIPNYCVLYEYASNAMFDELCAKEAVLNLEDCMFKLFFAFLVTSDTWHQRH